MVDLGELLPDRYAPRLTAVRVELDWAAAGDMKESGVEGGGRPWL